MTAMQNNHVKAGSIRHKNSLMSVLKKKKEKSNTAPKHYNENVGVSTNKQND